MNLRAVRLAANAKFAASPVSSACAVVLSMSMILSWLPVSAAEPQVVAASSPKTGAATKATGAEQGMRWPDLKSAQQAALKPLEAQWAGIDARSKQKWVELASKFPKMTSEEQSRVQQRMTAWTKLTPRERGEARARFQEAKGVSAEDRRARWKTYEALSPDEKLRFTNRGAPGEDRMQKGPADLRTRATHDAAPQAKSNIVPNPALAASPKAVAPTVVQARPGATTTLVTKRALPPNHQQPGLPKIAATPEFVNKATLLPHRGPQGAATRSAQASAPEAAGRR